MFLERNWLGCMFEANHDGKDVDPNVHTLIGKVALVRKTIDKFPEQENTYVENITQYKEFYRKKFKTQGIRTLLTLTKLEWGPYGC